jgi:hypothetical protein
MRRRETSARPISGRRRSPPPYLPIGRSTSSPNLTCDDEDVTDGEQI